MTDKSSRVWHPSRSMLTKRGWNTEIVDGRLIVFGWRTPYRWWGLKKNKRNKNDYKPGNVYVSKTGIDYDSKRGCSRGLHMWKRKKNEGMVLVGALVSECVFSRPLSYVSDDKARSLHLFCGRDCDEIRKMISMFLKIGTPKER